MVRLVAALLACALVLAGCVAPPAASDQAPSGVDDDELPPGVTTDGVSNASRLLDAHLSALNETGWKERHVMRFRGPHYRFDGVGLLVEDETIAATPGMEEIRIVQERRFESSELSETVLSNQWFDGNRELVKLRCPSGEVVYRAHEPRHDPALLTIRRLPVYGWLRAGDYELADVNRSGDRTLFTFVADEAATRAGYDRFVNGTFVVDSTGRIHRFETVGRWTTDDGVKVTRRDSYELLEVGVSDLEPPEWADTAEREATHGGCEAPSNRSE